LSWFGATGRAKSIALVVTMGFLLLSCALRVLLRNAGENR
jgi:hypothetical protein